MKKEQLHLTHPDKIYWPDEGITKGDLITYYRSMSPYMLPYLKNRPLSLKRNPNGIRDAGFYQKDAGEIAPGWMKTAAIYSESSDKMVHYLVCNDVKSLLFIANLGCIEINPWNSVIAKPGYPDYLVMDIDPSEKNTFNEVIDVAQAIKAILDKANVEAYCKTSGAGGMHVYIPCNKKYSYEQVRAFAKVIAIRVQEQLPRITTLERSLAKRKKNEVYIDYLQNSIGQTLACVYSVRPRPFATVSAPLEWKEVKHGLSPAQFTLKNMHERVKQKGDLFKAVLGKGLNMKPALKLLGT
ncbi:non-homologous end-joining DNA ligase [Agriterribacter sp.]|uniref:non-homologous end-joining DNA ligase n=1 Tax=Agriterribacter sp. TaxID=2821509 RepID=UPI002CB052CF|nr:non-homologous end-joining DNA ligase [Agriterribacter sp.]HTN08986.1 non-homologous end-joining DNA ligase [Agriterribacter sp.]